LSDHLGRFLLSAGLIDRTALTRALDAQHRRRCPLVAALVLEGLLDEEDLYQLHLYRARFDLVTAVSVQALSLLPAAIAERFWVVPVRVSFEGSGARLLYLATTDPEDTHSLAELSAFTESKIIPLVARFSAIAGALAQWYGVELAEEAVAEAGPPAVTADEAVSTTGEAVDTGEGDEPADEAEEGPEDAPRSGAYAAATLTDARELERARLALFAGEEGPAGGAGDAGKRPGASTLADQPSPYSEPTDPGATQGTAGDELPATAAHEPAATAPAPGAARARAGSGTRPPPIPAGSGAAAAAFSGTPRPHLRISSVDGSLDLDRPEPEPVPAHVAAWAGFKPGPEPTGGPTLSGSFPTVRADDVAAAEAARAATGQRDTLDDEEVELEPEEVAPEDDPALAAAPSGAAAASAATAAATRAAATAGPAPAPAPAAVAAAVAARAAAPGPARARVPSAAEAAVLVRDAPDRDAAVAAAMTAMQVRFARVMLFLVKPDAVQGFDGRGISVEQIKGIRIPIEIPSMFKDVRDKKSAFLGQPAKNAAHTVFRAALGIADTGEVLLMPVLAKGKVSLLLYADGNGKASLGLSVAEIGEWSEVARALGDVVDRLLATSAAR
jgi:hypothetical protein